MSVLAAALLLGQRPSPVADLPFRHEPGRIWLKGVLNGKPARTMLDSGAYGIYATEAAAARAGGVKGEASQAMTLGGLSDVWQTTMLFGLEGSLVKSLVTGIVSTARAPSDVGFDVAAGFDLLGVYGVEVDYPNARVRLYEPFAYTPPKDAVGLEIRFQDRRPVVQIEIQMPGGRKRKVPALVDTGSPVGMWITRRLAKRDGMDDRYADLLVEEQGGGLGGKTWGRTVPGIKARFGKVPINGAAIVDMTGGGYADADLGYDVLIGDDLLQHFDLAFDYAHATLWVKPNGK